MRTRNVPIEGRAAFEPFSTPGAPETAVPARCRHHSLVKQDEEHLPDPREGEITASFGSARLIRHEDGHWELQGGSHADQAAAREWCSIFQHEANFGPPPVAATDSEDQTRAVSRKLILVADDDALVRGNVAAVLESEGFRAEEACDGHEAVRRAIALAPDLVLLDLNMPGWDGWTAFNQLDRVTPLVPVIVITAWPNQYETA
ncbi:MAG TPA: response regulator, partial [Candidatus Nitrosotalea sp.]|nr:response regulator [Candidatus Nitrosotalea sp.]